MFAGHRFEQGTSERFAAAGFGGCGGRRRFWLEHEATESISKSRRGASLQVCRDRAELACQAQEVGLRGIRLRALHPECSGRALSCFS